mmetsp:Transcript_3652/g.6593  ORF Transcript_3652/g.6593 Transcript_3652/m.6593 type:complete len:1307 (+) Transcript_3652:173-4093(+)
MAALSSMSIMELKRELMDHNDSSFVFSARDELECALKAARRMEMSKKKAGLERSITVPSSSSTTSITAAATSVASSSSPDEFMPPPDLTSVSSTGGSTSRGSSQSSSSPSPARPYVRKVQPETNVPPPPFPAPVTKEEVDTAETVTSSNGASSGNSNDPTAVIFEESNNPEAADIFQEEPNNPESDSISRRLVEYFVMVSCIPIDDTLVPANNKANPKLMTKSRPPDPDRDKMNSRTKGRFDVRRVHLSSSINSSTSHRRRSSDNSTNSTDSEYDAMTDGVESTLLEPKITARYPPTDHADQPLNLRLPQFCHPEGTELIHPTTEYKMPRVHHFVLTDSMGGKQFGTCLTVYEEFNDSKQQKEDDGENSSSKEGRKKQTYYAPRVLVLLSTWPYLTAFRTYLTQLYRLATTTNVMTTPIERYVQNICSEVPAPPPGAFEVQLNILGSNIRFWAPPANQPIPYVSLPFKVLFECLDIGNVLFAWYTLACEQKVLLVSSQLSLLTVCSEILNSLLFPMKWSHLYIPVLPRSLSPMLDAPMPYLCGISRENFPYAVEDISDETVVVDLDRNVITVGPNTPDLPPLPHNRRKKLEATLKANAGEVFWEARNLTKADVLKVRASGNEGKLSSMLDNARSVWEEKIQTRDDAFNLAHAPDSVSLQFDEDANVYLDDGSLPKQSRWDAVQEAFLRFYVSVLQDYRKFLPENANLDARTSWRAGKDDGLSDLRFQEEEFVAHAPSEFQPFLEELTITQQFDDFVTRKMHNAADAPDIKFFDQSIDAKRNRSKLMLKKKETPFLHSASAHRDLKRVQAVEPNGEGLSPLENKEGAYMYEMWPLSFDETLFGTPRPIPSIISAEFDRRTALRSMLRSKYGIVDESRGLGSRNRSPEVTAFILFFLTFTSVIGKELSSVEQKGGPLVSPLTRPGRQSLTNIDDDTEVARTIAKAQIDLGYHTLLLMRARKLPPEPIAYKLLIQACGRCKVTHRASRLMYMLSQDGLAINSEIYTSLITAFSIDGSQPSSLALYQMYEDDNISSLSSSQTSGSNHHLMERHASSSTHSEHSLDLISESSPSEASSMTRKDRMKNAMASRLSVNRQALKKPKSKRNITSQRLSNKKHSLQMTAAVAKQIELGESLLESLYPSIDIDNENVCPKCATVLNETDICAGWTPCASNEYQTKCPSCQHKFVPKFSVSCKSPSFEGSQGKGTPLYCDHLSPWVLLREIRSVITATGGVDSILDEKFRKSPDISATLWWNMVVTFRRYKLPYIFLLQGSFQNQLILPSPSFVEETISVWGVEETVSVRGGARGII